MNYFDILINRLLDSQKLKGFTFKKGTSSFVQKFDGGWRKIELPHAHSIVQPSYSVRFDVAYDWYKKFCILSAADQRHTITVGASNKTLGHREFFFFGLAGNGNDDIELYHLEKSVLECATVFFNKYKSIEDVYQYLIEPVIAGNDGLLKIHDGGGEDWFFQYLTICRIVAPQNYEKYKEILLDYEAKWTTGERTNPNFMFYHDRLDEILSYMESLDFSKMMNKSK